MAIEENGSVTTGSVDWSSQLRKVNDSFGSAKSLGSLLNSYKGFATPSDAMDAIGDVAKIVSMFV